MLFGKEGLHISRGIRKKRCLVHLLKNLSAPPKILSAPLKTLSAPLRSKRSIKVTFDFSLITAFRVVENVSQRYFEAGFGAYDIQETPKKHPRIRL